MPSVERAQASGMRLTASRKLPEPVGRGRARYPRPGNAEDTRARGWTVMIPRQRADMAPGPARGAAVAARAAMRTRSSR